MFTIKAQQLTRRFVKRHMDVSCYPCVIVENTTLMNGDTVGTDRKSPVLTIFIRAQELSSKIHVMESGNYSNQGSSYIKKR